MHWIRHWPLPGIADRCASEACANEPSWRLEAGGVGSFYCKECREKIESDPHWGDILAKTAAKKGAPIQETITFNFVNEAQQKRFHEKLKDANKWTCAARAQGTAGGNDPAECDWPTCGCDDYASHVMFSLHEQGWRSPDEVHEYARKTREQVIREFKADKD